jgi:hypothetical protein
MVSHTTLECSSVVHDVLHSRLRDSAAGSCQIQRACICVSAAAELRKQKKHSESPHRLDVNLTRDMDLVYSQLDWDTGVC